MEFNPKVSIVIPVYNGSNYMSEAIDSALAQTYQNIEIIVVNDGSNDGGKTEEIAKSYGDKIRYFYKENGGVASALNFGINKMEGEYFSWLSHDDVYSSNKIEDQVHYLQILGKDVILYTDYDFIDHRSTKIGEKRFSPVAPSLFLYKLLTDYPVNGCTLLVPKKFLLKVELFDEKLKTTQDYDLWFKLGSKFEFHHIPTASIKSRLHSEQGSSGVEKNHIKESNELYVKFLDNIDFDSLSRSMKRSLTYLYLKAAISLKERKRYFEASNYACHLAMKSWPDETLFTKTKVLPLLIWCKLWNRWCSVYYWTCLARVVMQGIRRKLN